jgi:hypothetical protein
MRQKADTWQTCGETTQIKWKILKPRKFFPGDPKFGMKNAMFNLNGGHVKVIKFKWKLFWVVFYGSKHDPETKITKTKIADTINVKDSMFFPKSLNIADLQRDHPNQREESETAKIFLQGF